MAEAACGGNFLEAHPPGADEPFRLQDALAQNVAVRRHSERRLECPDQISNAEVDGVGQRLQAERAGAFRRYQVTEHGRLP